MNHFFWAWGAAADEQTTSVAHEGDCLQRCNELQNGFENEWDRLNGRSRVHIPANSVLREITLSELKVNALNFKPMRAPTAYILFMRAHQHLSIAQTAEAWKEMEEEAKREYTEKAEAEKIRYQQDSEKIGRAHV